LRWLENVEKGLWEIKVERWQQKEFDREEWASVSRETKAVSGP